MKKTISSDRFDSLLEDYLLFLEEGRPLTDEAIEILLIFLGVLLEEADHALSLEKQHLRIPDYPLMACCVVLEAIRFSSLFPLYVCLCDLGDSPLNEENLKLSKDRSLSMSDHRKSKEMRNLISLQRQLMEGMRITPKKSERLGWAIETLAWFGKEIRHSMKAGEHLSEDEREIFLEILFFFQDYMDDAFFSVYTRQHPEDPIHFRLEEEDQT